MPHSSVVNRVDLVLRTLPELKKLGITKDTKEMLTVTQVLAYANGQNVDQPFSGQVVDGKPPIQKQGNNGPWYINKLVISDGQSRIGLDVFSDQLISLDMVHGQVVTVSPAFDPSKAPKINEYKGSKSVGVAFGNKVAFAPAPQSMGTPASDYAPSTPAQAAPATRTHAPASTDKVQETADTFIALRNALKPIGVDDNNIVMLACNTLNRR